VVVVVVGGAVVMPSNQRNDLHMNVNGEAMTKATADEDAGHK